MKLLVHIFFLQRLYEHFKTEQYPSRTVKESLAEELGITSRQVCTPFAMIFQLDVCYGVLCLIIMWPLLTTG
jgi:hypothetical protein